MEELKAKRIIVNVAALLLVITAWAVLHNVSLGDWPTLLAALVCGVLVPFIEFLVIQPVAAFLRLPGSYIGVQVLAVAVNAAIGVAVAAQCMPLISG